MGRFPNSVSMIHFGDATMTLFAAEPTELLPFDGSAVLHHWVLGDRRAGEVFDRLLDQTRWESRTITMFGKQHLEPRMTAWHGDEGAVYVYSRIVLSPEPWTPLLASLRDISADLAGTGFNSVLLNLYRDGNDKMGWHADDEPELGERPIIASMSLGAVRRFKFRHRHTRRVVECELPSGSLLVMSGDCQSNWVHEVPRQVRVREPRINLTFRRVGAR